MPDLADLRYDGDVAIITIANPPVNALSHGVRAALQDVLVRAGGDAAVSAIVIACAGRTFVAGADIAEFGKPPREPVLTNVIATIEAIGKPIVAALHGTPLGGGLELALACHFRVAAPGTRLGLPEIKLGIIPGAGGTQRLPRLVGMDKAMAMILSGEPIGAAEAHEAGLVDDVVTGDLLTAAVAFARRAAAERRPLRLVRDRDDKLAQARHDIAAFEAAAAPYIKRAKGQNAPAAAVEALRGALTLPIADALTRRAAAVPRTRGRRPVEGPAPYLLRRTRGRQGAGHRGLQGPRGEPRRRNRRRHHGRRHCDVLRRGRHPGHRRGDQHRGARPRPRHDQTQLSGDGRPRRACSRTKWRHALRRITGTTDMAAAADADLAVEAVFEDFGVKQEVLGRLDRLLKGDAVIATNTSYLDVDALARATTRPQSVVGMHFFSPANVMRLVEVVRGAATSAETLATAIAVGRKLGKIPAVVGVCHGFVGNRMLRIRTIEAERLLLEGARPQDVDAALTGFGFPMGPFAMADLAGLDVSWRMRKAQGLSAPIADALCERGRFGQKTARGFYLYEAGSRTPKPDPEVEILIAAEAARRGVAQRVLDAGAIVERLLFPMINEGARILAEGIARRPGDIDVIWVYGYGFPVYRGGPMHYADSVGLASICDRLMGFAASTGDDRHRPCPLLARLAAEGKAFAALTAQT